MELFIWPEIAICAEHLRRFPQESHRVNIKMPLFFPEVNLYTVCSCRNSNCPILKSGVCSGRATFIEIYPTNDNFAGMITPVLDSVPKSRRVPAGLLAA